jgi:Uma2 family endonuclease
MGTAVQLLPHYTYEDYKIWEGKWEIIEGVPYAMSPAPLPKHQRISNSLGALFFLALKESKCKHCIASDPIDYMISEDTVVQPDLLIYCGSATKPYLDFTPKLIVEILSPSTAMKDRHTKFNLYEKAGVRWYLIINPDTEIIQIFTLENDTYVQVKEGHELRFAFQLDDKCRIEIDFEEIW